MIENISSYFTSIISLFIFCFIGGYVLRFGLRRSGIYQDFIVLAFILLACFWSGGML